jgi:hypothetical protein
LTPNRQLLRTRPERVAATVVLSGFVQAAPQPADEQLAAERPAVFWGRGARDPMIPADAIERTRVWLTAHSTLTERVHPGLAAAGAGGQRLTCRLPAEYARPRRHGVVVWSLEIRGRYPARRSR